MSTLSAAYRSTTPLLPPSWVTVRPVQFATAATPDGTGTTQNRPPASVARDLGAMGLPFESLALRDLRTYAQSLGARLIAVTAFGHAYQTDDAIAVMPLTALKP